MSYADLWDGMQSSVSPRLNTLHCNKLNKKNVNNLNRKALQSVVRIKKMDEVNKSFSDALAKGLQKHESLDLMSIKH